MTQNQRRLLRFFTAFLCFFSLFDESFSQNIEWSADNIEGLMENGKKVRRLTGNVVFRQPGRSLYSNMADQYQEENRIKCVGSVLIRQDNGSTITGDTLHYLTVEKKARVVGNVVLNDKNMRLTTSALDYDMVSGTGIYTTGGVIIDGTSRLTSVYGQFDKTNNQMFFRNKVVLTDGENILETDSLRYNTLTKMAYFFGNSKITNKEGIVYSTKGSYNTETKKGDFTGRSRVENLDYTLWGDKIDFNRETQSGVAKGNVIIFVKKDSLTLTGENAYFSEVKGFSKVYGKAFMKYPMENKDTLFLTGDTLHSLNHNTPEKRILKVYHRARFMMAEVQGICDSLIYLFNDSTLHFFTNPMIWSGKNQISADTIRAFMVKKQMDHLLTRSNSFIVSQDTLGNFNQLKGKNMKAIFSNNNIRNLNVYGNGQCIYYALEGDSSLIGMNKMNCTDLRVNFAEKNKLKSITALNQPDAIFYPPHEIEEPETKLKGFVWKVSERPTKVNFIAKNEPKASSKESKSAVKPESKGSKKKKDKKKKSK